MTFSPISGPLLDGKHTKHGFSRIPKDVRELAKAKNVYLATGCWSIRFWNILSAPENSEDPTWEVSIDCDAAVYSRIIWDMVRGALKALPGVKVKKKKKKKKKKKS